MSIKHHQNRNGSVRQLLTALLLVTVALAGISTAITQETNKPITAGYVPENGFVPDAKTAIKIAEAVLMPVYGEAKVTNARPYKAKLSNDKWVVKGSVPKPPGETIVVGGYAEVHIMKQSGCVTLMRHTR